MHYKNGNEAHEGDPVICRPDLNSSYTIAGKLHSIQTLSDTCNGQVAVTIQGGVEQTDVNIKDCYHAADAYETLDKVVAVTSAVTDKILDAAKALQTKLERSD